VSEVSERQARWPVALAAVVGAFLFLSQGGWVALNVTRFDWIQPGSDWAYHTLAWVYFRNAEWQLPLGAIPDLLHPVGSTVVLTDAIPWVALPMKVLAPLFPNPIQLIGPWLFLCYLLAGWFGARLAQALGARPIPAFVVGVFFAISPVLMHRLKHEALAGHFLILWALAAYVSRRKSTTLGAVLVPLVAFGVHPYLFAMVLPISLAALVRAAWVDRLITWRLAAAATGALFAALALVAWPLGYFSAAFAAGGNGFSHYGTDLATFITTQKSSWFFRDLKGHPARWEGFAYLGAGGFLLVASAIVLEILARGRRVWRRTLPLAIVLVPLTLFALAFPWRLFGKPLVDLEWFWRPFGFFTGALRTSGRFIWPLYYAILAGAVGVWLLRRPRFAPIALALVLGLQIADTKTAFFAQQYTARFEPPAWSPAWQLARGEYRHLVLFPPRCGDGSGTCCPGFSVKPFRPDTWLMLHAAKLGLSTNSTGVGRLDRVAHGQACAELGAAVDEGRLDPRTIYQIGGGFEGRFRKGNPDAICAVLDGVLTCVDAEAPAGFREALQTR
jgi:hypothetical protein